MASSPSITVLLPARNAGTTVAAAVRCILTQTFADLELIALNDGSTDSTVDVLRGFDDPRLRVVEAGGRGLVHALNLGLRHARGIWVARMDADDECHPRRLELSAQALEQGLDGVGTQVEIFRDDRPVSPNLKAYEAWLNSLTSPELLFRDRLVESPLCHGSVLLRRDALESLGGWHDGDFPEDWDLWLRWLGSGRRLSCIAPVLYRWRDHDDRLTRTDSRYALDRHVKLKARVLASSHTRVCIAGAGRTGLQLMRLLRQRGVAVECFFDVNPKKLGRRIEGIDVLPPAAIATPADHPHLICAAGSKGAREQLRQHLVDRGWVEGLHFTSAA